MLGWVDCQASLWILVSPIIDVYTNLILFPITLNTTTHYRLNLLCLVAPPGSLHGMLLGVLCQGYPYFTPLFLFPEPRPYKYSRVSFYKRKSGLSERQLNARAHGPDEVIYSCSMHCMFLILPRLFHPISTNIFNVRRDLRPHFPTL